MSRRWADVSACVVTWARRRPWCFTHGRYFGVRHPRRRAVQDVPRAGFLPERR